MEVPSPDGTPPTEELPRSDGGALANPTPSNDAVGPRGFGRETDTSGPWGDEPDGAGDRTDEGQDGDEVWPARAVTRRLSMRAPTAVLLAMLVAAGAFWGGAALQRSRATAPATSGLSGIVARLRASLGGSGASGAFGGFSGVGGGTSTGSGTGTSTGAGTGAGTSARAAPTASGILTAVHGTTLYLTSVSGALVTVAVTPTTIVTEIATGLPPRLALGDAVDVVGTRSTKGAVVATSVVVRASVAGAGAGTGASAPASSSGAARNERGRTGLRGSGG